MATMGQHDVTTRPIWSIAPDAMTWDVETFEGASTTDGCAAVSAWVSPADAAGAARLSAPFTALRHDGTATPPGAAAAAGRAAIATLASGRHPAFPEGDASRLLASSGFAVAREPAFFDRMILTATAVAFAYEDPAESIAAAAARGGWDQAAADPLQRARICCVAVEKAARRLRPERHIDDLATIAAFVTSVAAPLGPRVKLDMTPP